MAEHVSPILAEPTGETARLDGLRARVGAERWVWYRAVAIGLGAFCVSRLIVYGGVYARAAQEATRRRAAGALVPESLRHDIQNIFLQWDGKWYRMIAANGYPRHLADHITFSWGDSASVAFFPVYPALARAFSYIFPGGVDEALLGVNVVLSVIAMVLVGLLARDLYGIDTATMAMVLFAVFPGSAALTWSYAEPAMIVFAAATMLAMSRERWVLAGVLAAITSATRPNAVAIVAACAVAAAIVIWRRRQWWSLVTVAMSPLGYIGYRYVYLRLWTGESDAWMRAQREAWGEGWSWGATAVRFTWRFLQNPLDSQWGTTYMHTAFAIACVAFGAFCAWRVRLAWPLVAFSAVVFALMVGPETVSARPRFVLAAFPLAIAVAAWLSRQRRPLYNGVVLASAGSLAVFTVIYASWSAIP